MIDHGRLRIWSVAALIFYTLAYYLDWALFRYYYETGAVGWLAFSAASGPSISWYGWLGTASIGATFVSLAVPARVSRLLPAEVIVLIASAAALAILLYERRWFF